MLCCRLFQPLSYVLSLPKHNCDRDWVGPFAYRWILLWLADAGGTVVACRQSDWAIRWLHGSELSGYTHQQCWQSRRWNWYNWQWTCLLRLSADSVARLKHSSWQPHQNALFSIGNCLWRLADWHSRYSWCNFPFSEVSWQPPPRGWPHYSRTSKKAIQPSGWQNGHNIPNLLHLQCSERWPFSIPFRPFASCADESMHSHANSRPFDWKGYLLADANRRDSKLSYSRVRYRLN